MKTQAIKQRSGKHHVTPLHEPGATCPSCGQYFTGKFCSNCGEKQVSHHDYSVKHFIEEGIEGLTHFDGKFLQSIKLLLFRPGALTQNYFQGRRVPFMKPFQLFIICNLVFFLFLHGGNMFAIHFENYHDSSPYTWFHTTEVIDKKAVTHQQFADYSKVFNEKIASQSKTFIIVFIPMLAAVLGLLYYKKRHYYTEHLVFATHFFSFVLMYFLLILYVVVLPLVLIGGASFDDKLDGLLGVVSLVVLSVYFGKAARKFYKVSGWYAALSTVLFTGFFAAAVLTYRMMLFYKIFYSIHL